jgi:hypothetical protein
MVAAQALKKLPTDKDEWLASYKDYILTEANGKMILDHLRGIAEPPERPAGNNAKLLEIYSKESKEFDQRKAAAWKFVYDIAYGTNLKSLVAPFVNTFDHVRAWSKIVDYYETQTSHSTQQSSLEN